MAKRELGKGGEKEMAKVKGIKEGKEGKFLKVFTMHSNSIILAHQMLVDEAAKQKTDISELNADVEFNCEVEVINLFSSEKKNF